MAEAAGDMLVDRPADGVVRLRLNRPAARNALSLALRRRLVAAIAEAEEDSDTRCLILAGGDKVFAAGADIAELAGAGPIDMMLRASERLWDAIARCRKPIVAAVRGAALGGGWELALHADLIVAGDAARFGLPEIRIGIMPGAGGTQRLTRLVGKHRALDLLLTGRTVTAAEAFALGTVNRLVPDAEVDATSVELAAGLAQMPPLAVRQIKGVVLAGADCALDAALALERNALQVLFASADKEEGVRAFLEKRAPDFVGR
jgi:enoyl-CoA hydratase/carnithine racemase